MVLRGEAEVINEEFMRRLTDDELAALLSELEPVYSGTTPRRPRPRDEKRWPPSTRLQHEGIRNRQAPGETDRYVSATRDSGVHPRGTLPLLVADRQTGFLAYMRKEFTGLQVFADSFEREDAERAARARPNGRNR